MAGHAHDLDIGARAAGDRGDDADRQIVGFKHRSLLDMQFEIAQDIVGARAVAIGADARRIEAEAHQARL